jgi:monoamine oxidase
MVKGEAEVAVIGGGAAGIAAGRYLHDAGLDCVILEARARLGGRAWSVEAARGCAIDLGCGWLHSADRNPWSDLAAARGFTIDKTPPPWRRRSSSVGFPPGGQAKFLQALTDFYERLEAKAGLTRDVPTSDFLDPGDRWNPLINAIGTFVSGAELDRVSARDFINYDDSGVNWRVVQGYGTAIADHAQPVPVVLDCPVTRIDHSGRRISIETARGAVSAEAVIVTVPTALLADGAIAFHPALPDKAEAAAGLPLGLADKLFLSLDRAEEFEKDSRVFGRTDSVATGAYHLRPFGRAQIEGYFGGALAAELEKGGVSAFVDFATRQLVGLFGADFAKRIAPIKMHLWGADPFARGAYSYAQPGNAGGRAILAAPVDERLFFAGEACSEHDFSTAHGAYLTGIAAAQHAVAARRRTPA